MDEWVGEKSGTGLRVALALIFGKEGGTPVVRSIVLCAILYRFASYSYTAPGSWNK